MVLSAALTVVTSVALTAPAAQSPAARSPESGSSDQSGEQRRTWVTDTHRYTSRWYARAHRKMINYGCTRAPFYDPDPRCIRNRGFHHGLDIAMPCGTRLFAGFRGAIVRPGAQGTLGTAYGRKGFRIRNYDKGVDVVIGHARRVYVDPGDRIRRGQLIARANKLGAPDGCHLHFEVRPIGGEYQDAVRPHPYLKLRRWAAAGQPLGSRGEAAGRPRTRVEGCPT